MKRTLQNARIIITGASSGIGRELALQASKSGAKIVISARRTERLEALREQIQKELPAGKTASVEIVSGDVTSQEVRETIVARCLSAFGGVDILINNAGAAATGLFEENTPERFQRVMNLNLTAPVELTRLVIPLMKPWKNHEKVQEERLPESLRKYASELQFTDVPPMIVNLSSIVGMRGVTHYSEYCAAKAGLRIFSESLRTELHRYGIEILVVCPGSTDTGFFTDYIENTGEPTWPHHHRVTPKYVASEILKAVRKGKHSIIPFYLGKVMNRLNFFCPTFMDSVMVHYSKLAEKKK